MIIITALRTIVARNLKYIRYQKNLSQEDFYEHYNLNPKYYSMIERGEINIRVSTIDKLAKTLKVPLQELLVDDSTREINKLRVDARN